MIGTMPAVTDRARKGVSGRLSMAAMLLLIVVGSASPVASAQPPAASAPPDDAASALAQKYRPVIGIQTQSTPCGPGEPYLPTDALATSE
ncbi:MAG: hypothetical protein RLZZ623_841, partial [Actinomycetota bacterium]